MNKKLMPFVILVGLVLLVVGWYGVSTIKRSDPSALSEVKNGEFYNEAIGWAIKIPDGWDLLPNVSNETSEKATSKYDEMGIETNLQATQWLIGFKKDDLNFFRAFYEVSPHVSDEHLRESMIIQRESVPEMFPAECMITGLSSISKEYVDKREFLKFSLNVSVPKTNKIISAIFYLGIIDDKYFGTMIYSTAPDNKSTLLKAWTESKFENYHRTE